jgi:outer membrane protein assembly factor BamB
VVNNIAVIAHGRNDRGQPRLYGIRLGGQGTATDADRIWERSDIGTFVPTPAEYQGRVYLVRDHGEVECINPSTGKSLWTGSFPKNRSNFYASPLIAGGKLYAAREDGVVFVAKIDDRFELLAENNIGERVIASLIPADNRIFIRGQGHLFCIASL